MGKASQAGKGAAPRPREITQAEWDANYSRIFGKKDKKNGSNNANK